MPEEEEVEVEEAEVGAALPKTKTMVLRFAKRKPLFQLLLSP